MITVNLGSISRKVDRDHEYCNLMVDLKIVSSIDEGKRYSCLFVKDFDDDGSHSIEYFDDDS